MSNSDFDANIARCQERIETGILPDMYRRQLESFKQMKAVQDEKLALEPGLSVEVAERLYLLTGIEEFLMNPERPESSRWSREADHAESDLINLRGLIQAYRSKEIEWHEGEVILFHKGKALGPWKEMTMQEITDACRAYGNEVWVEGVRFYQDLSQV